jgi:hypothetical protein
MRRPIAVTLVLAGTLALTACGSSGGGSAANPTTSTSVNQLSSPLWEKAKPTPSKSAQMVCQKEARNEIASSLGIKEQRVTPPVWVRAQHLYSCTYVYPKGSVTLLVKEMSSEAETTAYFDRLKKKYGANQEIQGLGQGAWVLKNNDLLVRKDYKVLLVDVTKIPATFAQLMTPSDVAINVGNTIMGCWTGA